MRCPNCDNILSLKNNRCDRCGEDVRVYRRVVKASNAFYNQGLMKARVRDLSGAVISLRTSLELDKHNTNARNLLGLVYYEMGETVYALSEWVLSKHLQSKDNDADEYMNMVQSNPTRLESINQAIKKYNFALQSAKQGSPDLAIIQLKKVITLNSKFIRAYQLLALLYMHEGENDKAGRILKKAAAIDVNNTVTLNYMREIGVSPTKVITEVKEVRSEEMSAKTGTEYTVFSNLNEYKEEKPNIWAYLNLVIGAIVGIAVACLLIFPTIKNNSNDDLNKVNKEQTVTINSLKTEKNALINSNESLNKQIDDLKKQLAAATATTAEPSDDPNNEDTTIQSNIDSLLNATSLYLDKDLDGAAKALVNYDGSKLTEYKAAAKIYDFIKSKTFENAATKLYNEGYKLYNKNKFEDAIKTLQDATKLKENYEDAIYFIGRSYQKMEDYDNARTTFQSLIDANPNSRRGKEAKKQLNTLPD